jgi:hypothetical protein
MTGVMCRNQLVQDLAIAANISIACITSILTGKVNR